MVQQGEERKGREKGKREREEKKEKKEGERKERDDLEIKKKWLIEFNQRYQRPNCSRNILFFFLE